MSSTEGTKKSEDFLGIDRTTWALALGGVSLIIGGALGWKTIQDMQRMGQLPPFGVPTQQDLINQQLQQQENNRVVVQDVAQDQDVEQARQEANATDQFGNPVAASDDDGIRIRQKPRGQQPWERINI
jgi:hypothetical protein